MQIDKNVLFGLTQSMAQFQMKIHNKLYAVDTIKIEYTETPVSRPTTRGGVYFSDKMSFKIRAHSSDVGLAKTLSKTMLGPNSDFENIEFLTRIDQNGIKNLKIFANLINYVQRRDGLELNLMVIGTELSN